LSRLVEVIRVEQPEFMPRGLDLNDLLDLAPANGALVIPLLTTRGSVVFVLPGGARSVSAEHVVSLGGFTALEFLSLLRGTIGDVRLGGWLGAYFNQADDRAGWLQVIEAAGRVLWDGLFERVHQCLAALGVGEGAPVVLLPQGALGFLPLHAAWRQIAEGRRY